MTSIFGTGSQIKQQLSYRKFQSNELKILIPGKKYHLQRESQRALEALGHQVHYLPVPETASELVRELIKAMVQFKPDMLLTINHIGFDAAGTIGQIFEELQLPVAAWYVDSPEFVLGDQGIPAKSMTTLFMWEKMLVPKLKSLGVEDTYYLPLGTDVSVFKPRNLSQSQALCFVGDSMTRARDKWNARIPSKQLHLVKEFAQALYLDRNADIAERIAQNTPTPDLELTLNLVAASTWTATAQYRNELLKNFDSPALKIYGDDNWPQIMPHSQFMGPVNYGEDLSQVYEGSTINLNATSLQMQTAVNQRVFDVPASGGLIITDAQADAMEHFDPGQEIVTYGCTEELKDKVKYFQDNETQRSAVIQAAYRRVHACHTYEHRLAKLLECMQKRHA